MKRIPLQRDPLTSDVAKSLYDSVLSTARRDTDMPDPSASFASWLRRQRHRDDAVGDLARDFQMDEAAAELVGHGVYLHVQNCGGTSAALDAVTRAEAEWRAGR